MTKKIIMPDIEDVFKVAKELKMDISQDQAQAVLDDYVEHAIDAKDDFWFEIVENILYNNLKNEQTS